jgi:hypothetical protein
VVSLAVLLGGCAGTAAKKIPKYEPATKNNPFLRYYSQVAPTKYPPPPETFLFKYQNVSLDEIYDLLFSDYLIVGRSRFIGADKGWGASGFANSLGADAVIISIQRRDTRINFITKSRPASDTTNSSGHSGAGPWYGSATSFETSHTTVPVQFNRYSFEAIYLRNVNNIVPLWKRVRDNYKKTGTSDFDGEWENSDLRLKVFLSGTQIVAFLSKPVEDRSVTWEVGDLRFLIGVDSGTGIYLMDNATPQPAEFRINKFGHLEVKLLGADEVHSFARVAPEAG